MHFGAVTGDFLVMIDKRASAAAVRLSSIGLGQSVPLHAGAPLFDEVGHVIGGISVDSPAFRISDERLDSLGHLIRDTAEAISRAMGSPGTSPRRSTREPNVQEV